MASKRFKKLPENSTNMPAQHIDKLIGLRKKNCTTKFDESVDLSFQINNNQKKTEMKQLFCNFNHISCSTTT